MLQNSSNSDSFNMFHPISLISTKWVRCWSLTHPQDSENIGGLLPCSHFHFLLLKSDHNQSYVQYLKKLNLDHSSGLRDSCYGKQRKHWRNGIIRDRAGSVISIFSFNRISKCQIVYLLHQLECSWIFNHRWPCGMWL